jgi:signal recognition particle subunit SRP54
MFENLKDKLGKIFDDLKSRGVLTEQNIDQAMREIRITLLEADVALSVVKKFIEEVKQKALGQEVIKSISPGQMVVKIVHDHLIKTLGQENIPINIDVAPPVIILMLGLQGSGKTTSSAKLAKRLTQKDKKRVLMASLDTYRPAAQEQLSVLGSQLSIETLGVVKDQQPVQIAEAAKEKAKLEGFDILILDTAGRSQVDETLMNEIELITEKVSPHEKILVADAMTGQEAVKIADTFHKRLDLTGIMLTRLDGDARGGAALSMTAVTGCPIKLIGIGEKLDEIDNFHPERIASQILEMGDVVGLVEKASETIDKEEAEKVAEKIKKGKFDLEDFSKQLSQISKMGGINSLIGKIPGLGKVQDKISSQDLDKDIVKKQQAIIFSMTPKERTSPAVLNASRKKRIASGSGSQVQDINILLKQFKQMNKMMKQMKKSGFKGLLNQGISQFKQKF